MFHAPEQFYKQKKFICEAVIQIMEPKFDLWTVALTVAASHGVFLSILIFLRKSSINNLLGALILSFSICLYFYIAYWTGYIYFFPTEIGALGGMPFLMGPLMLFYLQSERKTLVFKPAHLLPFSIYVAVFFLVDVREIAILLDIIQNIHLGVYSWLIIRYISNKPITKIMSWKRKLAWSFIGYTATFMMYYALVWTDQLQLSYDYAISIASSLFIYYIGYQGFKKSSVLKQFENGKYDQALLSASAAQAILSRLKTYMQDQSPYLNSELKLHDVATNLSLSTHDISQVLNNTMGKNFADFVNSYRVESAKKDLILTDKKIIHVAYDAGFNNKVSFNNAFKKHTGLTPSQFRDSQVPVI